MSFIHALLVAIGAIFMSVGGVLFGFGIANLVNSDWSWFHLVLTMLLPVCLYLFGFCLWRWGFRLARSRLLKKMSENSKKDSL